MAEKKNTVLDGIKNDLTSTEDVVILAALKKIPTKGNDTVIEPMLEVLLDNENPKIQDSIITMLHELKISKGQDALMAAVVKEKFEPLRKEILSAVWNCGFMPIENLHDIIKIAVKGSFEEAIEVMTILDTFEDELPDGQLMDSLIDLRAELNENPKTEKAPLLRQMVMLLEAMERLQ